MGDLENDLLLRACRREPVPRRPVWIMRQAGRYLPAYRAVRKGVDFLTLCRTPELAAKVTIQPVDAIDVDAAIIFSDILLIPVVMGMELAMIPGEGPRFADPVRTAADVDALRRPDPSDLGFVYEALGQTRRTLAGRVPLIGFCGSPWTLFCYMVEGGGSRDFAHAKAMMYAEPSLTHRLLITLADFCAEYLAAQLDAGADVVQIFDTWGGLLAPGDYEEFSLAPMRRLIDALPSGHGPVILYSKGVHHSYRLLADSGADVVGLDWTAQVAAVREEIGNRVALQGNLDPTVLLSTPNRIAARTAQMLTEFEGSPGHIANLGHGILKETPVENARAFVQAIRDYESNGKE